MRDHLGSSFNGTVSSVTGFGLFVALDDIYTEGLIHVSELGADYFHFDAAKHQMLGERTGKRYRLGDRVRVRVVRVDMESTKIDFVLVEDSGPLTTGTDKGLNVGAWGGTAPAKKGAAKKSVTDKTHKDTAQGGKPRSAKKKKQQHG
jgi:ribonuclease R